MIGINFCRVDNTNIVFNLIVLEIEKNHPWKGAPPSLIIIDKLVIKLIKKLKFIINKIEDKINKIEAILWIKKYFILFSIGLISMDDIIGKNLKIFNSKESHNKNIEFLLILSINLKIKQIKNNIKGLKIIILIRKKYFFPLLTVVCF